MMNSLKEMCSKVINEYIAQERAEAETEINTLVGLSWDALYLKTCQERNKHPFYFTRVLQHRESGFSRPTTRIYRDRTNNHWQNMLTTKKGKCIMTAECYNTVVEAQPNEPSNLVKTISILENKDLNETVYYTNKRDYVNKE